MKKIFTLISIALVAFSASAQINSGYFEARLVNGSACNRVKLQFRPINDRIPVHTNDDCQGIALNGNTINYDLTLTLFWNEPSITNATDVLSLSCPSGGTGYDVRDVGGTGLLDLGGGFSGKGFSNGNFTPLDFPVSWVMNQWEDITEITLVGFNCELGSIVNFVQIVPFGMFTQDEDPNIAMDLPTEGIITDYTPDIESVLPLDLLSFEARKDGDRSVMLTWSTSNEVSINHFIVERSIDRTNWIEIGKVQAGGGAQVANYNFLDQNVFDSNRSYARFYYRLRIIEDGGYVKPSPIKVVLFDTDPGSAKVFIYPNPSTDGVNIEVDNSRRSVAAAEILMYNDLGQLVLHQEIPEDSRIEFVDFTKSNIVSGTYTLQVLDGASGILITEKLVVQR